MPLGEKLMFLQRWPVLRIALGLTISGIVMQLIPSRLENETMAQDVAQIFHHLVRGEADAAHAALQAGYVPQFLKTETQQAARATPDQRSTSSRRSVTLKASADSHFYSKVRINNTNVNFVVDTGASMVALTHEDAKRIGIFLSPSDYTMSVSTANGTVKFAPVTLDRVELGGISERDVQAAVAPKGVMRENLLGMSFLRRLSDIRISPKEMTLVR